MKTMDFIGELNDLGFGVSYRLTDIHIVKSGFLRRKVARVSYMRVNDKEINSRALNRMKPEVREKLLKLISDYASTPIEERK